MYPPVPSAPLGQGLRKNDSEIVPTVLISQASGLLKDEQAGKWTQAGRTATVSVTFRACARRTAVSGIAIPSIPDAGPPGVGDAPERHSLRRDYFHGHFTQRSQRARHSLPVLQILAP